MNTKNQAFDKYKLYAAMMNHQRGVHIKTLVTDRGGEYKSSAFEKYLAEQGTRHKLTVYDTPESNGIAE